MHPSGLDHRCGMTAAMAKDIALEAILWLARVQRKRTCHLLMLHASAAELPAPWWLERAHWPIDSIIAAAEKAVLSESEAEDG